MGRDIWCLCCALEVPVVDKTSTCSCHLNVKNCPDFLKGEVQTAVAKTRANRCDADWEPRFNPGFDYELTVLVFVPLKISLNHALTPSHFPQSQIKQSTFLIQG